MAGVGQLEAVLRHNEETLVPDSGAILIGNSNLSSGNFQDIPAGTTDLEIVISPGAEVKAIVFWTNGELRLRPETLDDKRMVAKELILSNDMDSVFVDNLTEKNYRLYWSYYSI